MSLWTHSFRTYFFFVLSRAALWCYDLIIPSKDSLFRPGRGGCKDVQEHPTEKNTPLFRLHINSLTQMSSVYQLLVPLSPGLHCGTRCWEIQVTENRAPAKNGDWVDK